LHVRANDGRKRLVPEEKTVAAKRNVLKSQLPLMIVAATPVLIIIIYFVYQSFFHSKCDGIFEQTTERLHGNLEVIKIKGNWYSVAKKCKN